MITGPVVVFLVRLRLSLEARCLFDFLYWIDLLNFFIEEVQTLAPTLGLRAVNALFDALLRC